MSLINSLLGLEYGNVELSGAWELRVLIHEVFQLWIRTRAKLHGMTIGAVSVRERVDWGDYQSDLEGLLNL